MNKAKGKASIYILCLNAKGASLELLSNETAVLNGEDVLVYYSSIYQAITIVSNLEKDMKFWRQLRLACGRYNIYNSEQHSRMVRANMPPQRTERYRVRNNELQKLFIYIENAIRLTKKNTGRGNVQKNKQNPTSGTK